MIKKTLKFEDLDGNPVEKDYYFHLTKAEVAEMQLSTADGLAENLRAIVATKDGALIMATFKKLILDTVGVRSEDGLSFLKSAEIRQAFEFSEAYSALFMEMVTQPDAALEFIKGVMPKDLLAKADLSELEKLAAEAKIPEEKSGLVVEVARKEIGDMSMEELRAALAGRTEVVVKE